MIGGNVKVSKSDNRAQIVERIKSLSGMEVFVGIPQEQSSRPGETINNAELAYIHTHGVRRESMRNEMDASMDAGNPYSKAYQLYLESHGSPLMQSPPRPIIEPAIKKHKDVIGEKLADAAVPALAGDVTETTRKLAIAGGVAVNFVQDWFDDPDNGWAPNAESTVKAKGSDRPLIDTGDLRKSITYVVGDKRD